MVVKNNKDWIDFKEIKTKVGIYDVLHHYGFSDTMKEKGDELVGYCPIHDDKQYNENSFSANLQKNIWHCFVCGKGGNVFDFVMALEDVKLAEAAEIIAKSFGIPRKTTPGSSQKPLGGAKKAKAEPEVNAKQEEPERAKKEEEYNKPLSFTLKNLDHTHPYLKERGLTEETIKTFGLGYCDKGIMKGRIVIPITNWKGELVAYAGRWPGDHPDNESKYKLPLGFKKHLEVFNFHKAVYSMSIDGKLIIVEGFFDCMKIWQAGFMNVVAVMGAEISEEQAEFITKTLGKDGRIITLFDGDEAGYHGAFKALSMFLHKNFVKEIRLDKGQQPDKLTEKQIKDLLS